MKFYYMFNKAHCVVDDVSYRAESMCLYLKDISYRIINVFETITPPLKTSVEELKKAGIPD